MSPFEVLYGWKCRTPVTWDSPVDHLMLGLNLLKDLEQLVTKVQQNLKEAHFIPVKSTYKAVNIVDIFLKEIFRLHGIPKEIISDRYFKFIGNFGDIYYMD